MLKRWFITYVGLAERGLVTQGVRADISRALVWGMLVFSLLVPFCLTGSCSLHSSSLTTPAYASLNAKDKPAPLSDMSDSERDQYALSLSMLVVDSPDTFFHLMDQDLRLIFDEPQMVRRDGDVAMWQYKSDVCVVDLYFTGAGHNAVVSHYEIRERRTAHFIRPEDKGDELIMTDSACLQSIAGRA